ncbi:Probable RNA-directed DNA polymerase from transposon X-element [Eumeta japonica]|uniref:Probable RNA-directed DNA polymerase from transposon X-element n=1 Tax=Eumeta variegata TaxID=151549 RepID=A0A4C1V0N3_EUMVA|nr:Probable RNA-directed DNA polymerase from transposon X-element [Eumeta japonica]
MRGHIPGRSLRNGCESVYKEHVALSHLTAAIKQLPRRAMVVITKLFNGILWTGHFPVSWKTGHVIAIPKAGKEPRLASSQLPITLLSHIVKLF